MSLQRHEVVPFDASALRFLVRRANGRWHLVDLPELDWNGWCGCEDFHFGRWPKLKAGAEIGDATRCRHIEAARQWVIETVAQGLGPQARQERKTTKDEDDKDDRE